MSSNSSPENLPANPSSSSSAYAAAGDAAVNLNPLEKTISCISCRRRKLKCDRVKPFCGTCTRLRHECEYPERRRHVGSRRRNMKELEERLAQVETKLVAETTKNNLANNSPNKEPDWNEFPLHMDMDMNMSMNMDFGNDAFLDLPNPAQDFAFQVDQVRVENLYSQEMVSLGLEEALPPDEMIEQLHQVYFDKVHAQTPMLHQQRYLTSMNLPSHMKPPICLRYIIWATAALMVDNFSQYGDVFYKRARKYIEQAEMKGYGETFVTIPIAQTWALIAAYEAKKTLLTRAWMSSGRSTRLCLMLGLHRLDGEGKAAKQILPPCKDWIELEERRRTFWSAFYSDRWASSGSGWPMMIDESLIMTNLPCSDEAFDSGIIEASISLEEALKPAGASRLSSFGGVILSACLFGHNYEHLHRRGPNEHPEDLINGDFWKRHREMDNTLSNTFMFLPDNLRLPSNIRNNNVVFLHMNIHASAICLHQAAVSTAEKNGIERSFIAKCQTRSLMAAEEIASIMRLITHMDASYMNSWMGFCLYVASGVFIQDLMKDTKRVESRNSLDFLVAAMRAIGSKHSTTAHFITQVELDIESSGINMGYSYVSGSIKGSSSIIAPRGFLSTTGEVLALPMPGHHIRQYTGVYQHRIEKLGLTTPNILDGTPGLPVERTVTPIFGVQPDTGLTNSTTAGFDISWCAPRGSPLEQARGFRASNHSDSASPSGPEGVQGTSTWSSPDTDGTTGPDNNLGVSVEATNNENLSDQSMPQTGATQQSWVFEATMPPGACPYSIF